MSAFYIHVQLYQRARADGLDSLRERVPAQQQGAQARQLGRTVKQDMRRAKNVSRGQCLRAGPPVRDAAVGVRGEGISVGAHSGPGGENVHVFAALCRLPRDCLPLPARVRVAGDQQVSRLTVRALVSTVAANRRGSCDRSPRVLKSEKCQ